MRGWRDITPPKKEKKKSEYEIQAENFLEKANAEIKLKKICTVNGFPFSDDKLKHNKYQVIITRWVKCIGKEGYTYSEERQYDFPFYGSYNDYVNQKRPTAYDVLACLEKYEVPDDVWDFASEYGFEIDSRKAYEKVQKIHSECKEQYEKLVWLFGDELMEDLQEIN